MAVATRQKLLYSQKDDDWKRETVEYIYDRCRPNNTYFDLLYKAANGEMHLPDYSHVVNPYGRAVENRPELQAYPAKLKNYPIIPQIIQLLIGEKRDRPLLASVIATNPDTINKKKAEEVLAVKSVLQQIYVNTLNDLGMETGIETKPVPPLDQVMSSLNDNWADQRSVVGQEVVNYMMEDLDLPEKFNKGFIDWIVTATVFSIKDVINDDVVYRIISPKNVGFIADASTEYIEDAEAVCVEEFMTKASFLDKYYSMIKESLIENEHETKSKTYENITDQLDRGNNLSNHQTLLTSIGSEPLVSMSGIRSNLDSNLGSGDFFRVLEDTVKVAYVNWTSMKKIKEITVINQLGEEDTIEVPDDYKVDEDLGEKLISEYWVNEKWEGYIVDDNAFYFGIQPIPIQRNLINNKSACKNLINGRIRRMGDRKAFSIVELILPHQQLINFAHYKLNNVIAKSKDKLLILPMGMIPDKNGWDMYTSMYYADTTGIMFIDESNEQTMAAFNAIKEIDLSLGNYIEFLYGYIRNIKAEAEEVVGVNQQRKANITAGDGLGTTQTAIAQSSVITADLFEDYEKFQEKELNGLLDISRFAYVNGKKAAYLTSSGRAAYLEITAENEDFCNAEFGVRVTSSAKEKEKFDKMKIFAETMASQKVKGTYLAAILNAESSFSKLTTTLEKIEAMEQELLQQQAQAEADQKNQELQAKMAIEQQKINLQMYQIDQDNITKEKVALIQSETALLGLDKNLNGVDDSVEVEKNAIARDKHFADIDLKRQELNLKDREMQIKASTEIYKANTALQIAKENKTKAEISKKAKKK